MWREQPISPVVKFDSTVCTVVHSLMNNVSNSVVDHLALTTTNPIVIDTLTTTITNPNVIQSVTENIVNNAELMSNMTQAMSHPVITAGTIPADYSVLYLFSHI